MYVYYTATYMYDTKENTVWLDCMCVCVCVCVCVCAIRTFEFLYPVMESSSSHLVLSYPSLIITDKTLELDYILLK